MMAEVVVMATSHEMVENVSESEKSDETEPENCKKTKGA